MNSKNKLHQRNKHNKAYNFDALCAAEPQLAKFVEFKYNKQTIDFAHPLAVKLLNKALLKTEYGIEFWDIPDNFLCPPIPGRVDYIHYLSDLLNNSIKNPPQGKKVKVLDIGTGANCIYPLLGHKSYGWNFTASDIDQSSIKISRQIINANSGLSKHIDCRQQQNKNQIFRGIIKTEEKFHLTLCNPPFHSSAKQAAMGSERKWNNLGKANSKEKSPALNFAGRANELWCEGGELAFIRNMIKESKDFSQQVLWFTSLVSKKDNLNKLKLTLKKAGVAQTEVVKMEQGQKVSRFIAWSFLTKEQQQSW